MAIDEAYREAEKKIEDAKRRGAKVLKLSPLSKNAPKLTELPESVAQLTQLQSLDLSYNQLRTLPEWLCQL
ncbi:MAG: leucine-rich repeat domain-containing protein, partial [Pyrinomonadaceae bacterium]